MRKPSRRRKKKTKEKATSSVAKPRDVHQANQTEACDTDSNESIDEAHISNESVGITQSSNNRVICVATVFIAIATVFYAIVSAWQWSVTKGQLSQMQRNASLENRAWLGVSIATHKPIEASKPAEGVFVFRNTGKTPAFIIMHGHTTCIRPRDLDVEALALCVRLRETVPCR